MMLVPNIMSDVMGITQHRDLVKGPSSAVTMQGSFSGNGNGNFNGNGNGNGITQHSWREPVSVVCFVCCPFRVSKLSYILYLRYLEPRFWTASLQVVSGVFPEASP